MYTSISQVIANDRVWITLAACLKNLLSLKFLQVHSRFCHLLISQIRKYAKITQNEFISIIKLPVFVKPPIRQRHSPKHFQYQPIYLLLIKSHYTTNVSFH